jgi:hypothetical protein
LKERFLLPSPSTARVRAFRARRVAAGLPYRDKDKHREYKREWKKGRTQSVKPFTGCDGEGCGKDALGRQLYMLFRMGERELFTGEHLRTEELLDFICDHPRGELLVGFAFGYDVTMILRDLPEAQKKRLFHPKTFGEGLSPFVWYKNFDIDYLPKQYFRVRRVKIERDLDGRERRVAEKGSTRTIFETFGFFQKSFVKVINEFSVGTEAGRISIAADKERRSSFNVISDRERSYCALEVEYLAELMEKLRGYCDAAGIRPKSWNGAGKLASALHRLHDTPRSNAVRDCVPVGVLEYSNMAYYGGRFEITRTGSIKEKVYEYDIRSAYPDAMRFLPCLEHGSWEEADGKQLARLAGNGDGRNRDDPLFVAAITFKTGCNENGGMAQLGGLPVRSKEGHLYWPRQGGGVYWSCEIASAEKLGAKITYKNGWRYNRKCDCHPFDWVEPLFEYRRSIGSSGPGYPIKLGINSLYGKLAQRKGNGAYCNMVWAGLITALTRSKLNGAIAANPGRIIMVATDAVYSLDPIELDCGECLGQWEATELPGLFIVQPGLYWCPAKRKRKSRGLSGKFFEEAGRTESFEKAWQDFRAVENSKTDTLEFPTVSVPVPGFIGLKLAMARNKPDMAGCWIDDARLISFDYRNKRQGHTWEQDCITTKIKAGYPGLLSLPHKDFLAAGGQEPWENARLMLDEQQDYIDLGIPYKD